MINMLMVQRFTSSMRGMLIASHLIDITESTLMVDFDDSLPSLMMGTEHILGSEISDFGVKYGVLEKYEDELYYVNSVNRDKMVDFVYEFYNKIYSNMIYAD